MIYVKESHTVYMILLYTCMYTYLHISKAYFHMFHNYVYFKLKLFDLYIEVIS